MPFLPYVITVGLSLFSLGANWWLDLTDWQTALTVVAATLACVFVSNTGSPWSRLIISAIIGAAMYIKGGIDKEARLLPQHEAEKREIHAAYRKASDDELARQQAAAAAATRDAAASKEKVDAERAFLQQQAAQQQAAADKDVRAHEPSLSFDAVRRLNALRMREHTITNDGNGKD